MGEIKIGDEFWSFSANKRAWDDDGKPIYRAHFYPVSIIDETSRSWVVGNKSGNTELFKVPKNSPFREKYAEFGERPMLFTSQDVEDECYVQGCRYEISRQILGLKSAAKLRKIAYILDT